MEDSSTLATSLFVYSVSFSFPCRCLSFLWLVLFPIFFLQSHYYMCVCICVHVRMYVHIQIIDEIVFLITFLLCLYLLNRKAIDFCILILHPNTLIKSIYQLCNGGTHF